MTPIKLDLAAIAREERSERVELRLSPTMLRILEMAAARAALSIQDYVISNAFQSALNLVTDNTNERLSPQDSVALFEALFRPPQMTRRMHELQEHYENFTIHDNR